MLARVNSIREEPGGTGRLVVTDMNGPLYFLDKKTKALTTYLNFNGRDEQPGLFDRFFQIRDTAAASASFNSTRTISVTAGSTRFTWKARRCRARSASTREAFRA